MWQHVVPPHLTAVPLPTSRFPWAVMAVFEEQTSLTGPLTWLLDHVRGLWCPVVTYLFTSTRS